MTHIRKISFYSVILLSFILQGCATMGNHARSESAVTRVSRLVQDEGVGDARYFKVKGKEYLVFDTASKERLENYPQLEGDPAKREFMLSVIRDAKTLGDKVVDLELSRISDPNGVSGQIESYKKEAAVLFAEESNKVRSLSGTEFDAYEKDLRSHIQPSIKTRGRTMRKILMLPFAPFVNAWMGIHILSKPHEALAVNFQKVDLYTPPSPEAGASADVTLMSDWQLIQRYAPFIAMEKKEKVSYDPKADVFGSVRLDGAIAAKAQPAVRVEDPAVYAYTETKNVQNVPVKMLVYTLWFPERPQIGGGFDPEVGSMQGSIIRISLNKFNQPVVYENVSSCGCYYKIFPTESLEKWAKEAYRTPLEKKNFVVENKVPGKIDADVPSLVSVNVENRPSIALYVAGTHEVMDITDSLGQVKAETERAYRLIAYDELESLSFNGGVLSLFDNNGLVRNADRAEATLLAPSGMFHPGTPRQRGTLMIYFDQADFDESHLLEKYLRLPEHAFERAV